MNVIFKEKNVCKVSYFIWKEKWRQRALALGQCVCVPIRIGETNSAKRLLAIHRVADGAWCAGPCTAGFTRYPTTVTRSWASSFRTAVAAAAPSSRHLLRHRRPQPLLPLHLRSYSAGREWRPTTETDSSAAFLAGLKLPLPRRPLHSCTSPPPFRWPFRYFFSSLLSS